MGCGGSKGSDGEVRTDNPAVVGMDDSKASAMAKGGFANFYTLNKDQLGEGQFAVVRLATRKSDKKQVAVKCIDKAKLTEEDLAALVDEVEVMKKLDHPNLVKLYDFFSEQRYFYLVMEILRGGELFNRIVAKTRYTEREARDTIRTLAAAMAYVHAQGVVHRDLKPENILLADDSEDAAIKIADFGFAKQADERGVLTLETACGTPGYVAPEILTGKPYGLEVDCWSLGVIFFILLAGYPPFQEDNQHLLFKKIKAGEFEFDPEEWDAISDGAKDLVRKLLVTDPKKRLTAAGILHHEWVLDGDVPETVLTGTIEQLKKFNARRKLKGAMQAVRAVARTKVLIKQITEAARTAEMEETEREGAAGGAGGGDGAAAANRV